ncbi:MAG: glycosyltransferase [Rhizomicrobium sp.]|jgi:glycosyltransferase involved in cell wall biosynthesis
MTSMQPESTVSAPSRKTLVMFAPYPPAKSGIADYVAELMPFHLAEYDVTLVIADDAPVPSDPGLRVLLASEFRKHRSYFEGTPKLYHIGNNPHHCYMLDFLVEDPGIVVLHDFNLCYLHEMATLKWGNEKRHLASMQKEFGSLGADILSWQLRTGFREVFTGYELPLNGDVLERATAVVTHSRQVQYKVAARVPHTPVWYVPHHLSPLAGHYGSLSKQAVRAELGLPANEIIVTAVGFVTRAKQIPMTLTALASLRGRAPQFRFVLAGERRPDEYDVDVDIERSGLSDLVTCTDYVDEETFFKHLIAADIVVNLRYPSGGEMSGTLIRSLGLGIPTIVLDHGPMGELPDSAVRKLAWGGGTQTALTETLRELMSNGATRLALGAKAAEYASQEHDIVHIAQRYSRIVHEASASPAPKSATTLKFHFPGTATIARRLNSRPAADGTAAVQNAGAMWWTTPSTPLGSDDSHRALVVARDGRAIAGLLTTVFDWNPSAIAVLTHEEFLATEVNAPEGGPLMAGQFAFALAVVDRDMDESSAAALLRRLNAALCRGGCLSIETSSSLDSGDGDPLLDYQTFPQRVRDAGFGGIRLWSAQDGLIAALAVSDRHETGSLQTALVTGRKVSDYSVWRYAFPVNGMPLRTGGRVATAPGS